MKVLEIMTIITAIIIIPIISILMKYTSQMLLIPHQHLDITPNQVNILMYVSIIFMAMILIVMMTYHQLSRR